MHILYLDDSGSALDSKSAYFVLGGVSLFERQTHWLEQRLDRVVEQLESFVSKDTELHGSPMRTGRGVWRRLPKDIRLNAITEALRVAAAGNASVRLFAAIIHKASLAGEDPVEFAFEVIVNRFDLMLRRLHRQGDTQRGIIVLDKSVYETKLQGLARDFKMTGHRWGTVANMAEVPLFVDSWASRLVQLADLIAYAVHRKYEYSDSSFFSIIENKFDSYGGVQQGLVLYDSDFLPKVSLFKLFLTDPDEYTMSSSMETGAVV